MNETRFTQPAIFAFEYAMSRLLHSFGVTFDKVAGHSFGEVAALVVAEALSLEDACRLVVARGQLSGDLPTGQGAMAVVEGADQDIVAFIAGLADGVTVAAYNSPSVIVLSGQAEEIAKLTTAEEVNKCTVRALPISHAFHSDMMVPMVPRYQAVLQELSFSALKTPMVSSVTGKPIDDMADWPGYFTDHLLGPVHFNDVMTEITGDQGAVFLELGAKPMLVGLGMNNDPIIGRPWIATCKTGEDVKTFLGAIGQLFAAGVPIDFSGLAARGNWMRTPLPTTPFNKQKHLLEAPTGSAYGNPAAADDRQLIERRRIHDRRFWFGEHVVDGKTILPATYLLDVIAGRAAVVLDVTCVELLNFQIRAMALVDPINGVSLQVDTYIEGEDDGLLIELRVLDPDSDERILVARANARAGEMPLDIAPTLSAAAFAIPAQNIYNRYAAQNVALGASFQTLSRVRVTGDAGQAYSLASPMLAADGGFFGPHPVMVDTALQVIEGIFETHDVQGAFVPVSIDRVVLRRGQSNALRCDAWNAVRSDGQSSFDFTLTGDGAEVLASGSGFQQFEVESSQSLPELRPLAVQSDVKLPATSDGKLIALCAGDACLPELYCAITTVKIGDDLPQLVRDADAIVLPVEMFVQAQSIQGAPSLQLALENMDKAFQSLAAMAEAHSLPQLILCGPKDAGNAVLAAATRALFGFARSFALEAGQAAPLCVTCPATPWAGLSSNLLCLIQKSDRFSGTVIELSDGKARPSGFVSEAEISGSAIQLDPDAAYVITGGMGSLGSAIIDALVSAGARQVHLFGRSTPAPRMLARIAGLEAEGIEVLVHQVDVSNRSDLQSCLYGIEQERPIRGVVHAAGVLADGLVGNARAEDIAHVLAAKPVGAMNLDAYFHDKDALDFFAVFSSTAMTQGAMGQSLHASACGMLEGLCNHRIAKGLPATCIHWGIWKESAYFQEHPEALVQFAKDGDAGLSHAQGAQLLLAALGQPSGSFEIMNQSLPERTDPTDDKGAEQKMVVNEGGCTSDAEDIADIVLARVARLTGQSDPAKLNITAPWRELGVDSLLMIELRNSLRKVLPVDLPAGVVMRSKSVEDLIEQLMPAETVAPGVKGGPCLALIPGITGEPLDFANLMPAFEAYECQVIEYPDDLDPWASPVTPQALIEQMVEKVRAYVNGRPVVLMGYSFGGKIASLVAHALCQSGEDVQSLFVLDIPADASARTEPEETAPETLTMADFTRMLSVSPETAFAQLDASCAAGVPDTSLRPLASVYWTNVLVSPELRAKPLDIPVTFVRAEQTGALGHLLPNDEETQRDPTWGWDGIAPGKLTVEVMAGDHFSMIRADHATALSAAVLKILAVKN